MNNDMKIFSGTSNPALAQAVCDYLKLTLGRSKIDVFPDGEKGIKLEDDVRGRDCFVIQSTSRPQDANLMESKLYCGPLFQNRTNSPMDYLWLE